MANAVTNYRLFGAELSAAVSPGALQFMEIYIGGADSDVTWDLNDAGGTFWTAAKGDVTYGAIAKKALAALLDMADGSYAFFQVWGGFINAFARVATASGTAYSQSVTAGIPTFAFDTGNAPTADSIVIAWLMKPGAVVQNVPFA
jgi:hypothetical protein